jgi:hypothetical protein
MIRHSYKPLLQGQAALISRQRDKRYKMYYATVPKDCFYKAFICLFHLSACITYHAIFLRKISQILRNVKDDTTLNRKCRRAVKEPDLGKNLLLYQCQKSSVIITQLLGLFKILSFDVTQ